MPLSIFFSEFLFYRETNEEIQTRERERKKKILRLERFIETFLPLSLSSLPSRPFGSKMNVLNNNNRTGEFEKGDKLTHATEREWGREKETRANGELTNTSVIITRHLSLSSFLFVQHSDTGWRK